MAVRSQRPSARRSSAMNWVLEVRGVRGVCGVRKPVGVELGPAMTEKQLPRVRSRIRGKVDVGNQDVVLAERGAGDDVAFGVADERLAGKLQAVLAADAIAERNAVAVVECGNPHLAL